MIMKRFIFICSFVAFTANVIAQSINEIVPSKLLFSKTKKPTRNKGLQYTLEVGYNNALSFKDINEDLTHGEVNKSFWATGGNFSLSYKINSKLAIGAGVGLHFIWTETPTGTYDEEGLRHHKGIHNIWDGTLEDYSLHKEICGNSVDGNRKDFFLRAMYRLNDKKVSPLITIDAGYRLYSFDGGLRSAYDHDIDDANIEDLESTFFVSPSLGLSLRTSNNSCLELKLVEYSL